MLSSLHAAWLCMRSGFVPNTTRKRLSHPSPPLLGPPCEISGPYKQVFRKQKRLGVRVVCHMFKICNLATWGSTGEASLAKHHGKIEMLMAGWRGIILCGYFGPLEMLIEMLIAVFVLSVCEPEYSRNRR